MEEVGFDHSSRWGWGGGGVGGVNFVRGGRKGRDFREILGERVGGGDTHFLAWEREEMV
jgi:hypothetical protein